MYVTFLLSDWGYNSGYCISYALYYMALFLGIDFVGPRLLANRIRVLTVKSLVWMCTYIIDCLAFQYRATCLNTSSKTS